MGRPEDTFCWENVEKLPDKKWRCNFCGLVVSGNASRIRSHFSGEGGGIRKCQKVPKHIQEEALSNETNTKRARHSSPLGDDNDINATNSTMINNSSQNNDITNVTASTTANEVTRLGAANDNSVLDASASERLSNGDNAVAASTMINNIWVDSSFMPLITNYTSNVTASTMGNNCLELVAPHQASSSNDVANNTVVEYVTDPSLDASERLSNGDNVVTDTRETNQDPIPSSSGGPNLLSVQDSELYVAEALVKSLLLKSNNLLVDFIKDPNFQTFLERVRQYGVPASLLGGDTPIIEKSLMSCKKEVRRHISKVKESWNTTGCAMMVYNLTRMKGKFSDLDKDNNVVGFYSPKGFIFFEDLWMNGMGTSQSLHFHTDVTYFISHDDDRNQSYCELVDPRSISHWEDKLEYSEDFVTQDTCLRQRIQMLCSKICKGSEWLKGLFNKAEQIHQHIVNSHLRDRYYGTLKKKELKEFEDGKQTSPPSSFVSIMLLEDELKTWLPNPICCGGSLEEGEIEAALNDSEFWIQGRLVQRALNLILEIPNLMDTLVPSAGYFKLAFDNVKRELNSCNRPCTPMLDEFWKDLNDGLERLDSRFYCSRGATRLNPAYFHGNEDLDLSVSREVDWTFRNTMGRWIDEVEKEEIKRYSLRCSNPFANISQQERQNTHPIKLWENHGNDFPQLQKCAIHLFSQPVSCLCNQVKKHLSELQGADNLILRLNARMMEDFQNLGDDIYKPIDYKQRLHW